MNPPFDAKNFVQKSAIPTGIMIIAIILIISIMDFNISELCFFKYLAPALIFIAKLSKPTFSTFVAALPDTT